MGIGFNPLDNSSINFYQNTYNNGSYGNNVGSLFLNDMMNLTNMFATGMLVSAFQSAAENKEAQQTTNQLYAQLNQRIAKYDTDIAAKNTQIETKKGEMPTEPKETLEAQNTQYSNSIEQLQDKMKNNTTYTKIQSLKSEIASIENTYNSVVQADTDYKKADDDVKNGTGVVPVTLSGIVGYKFPVNEVTFQNYKDAAGWVCNTNLTSDFQKTDKQGKLIKDHTEVERQAKAAIQRAVDNIEAQVKNLEDKRDNIQKNAVENANQILKSNGKGEVKTIGNAKQALSELKGNKEEEVNKLTANGTSDESKAYDQIQTYTKNIADNKALIAKREKLEAEIETLTKERDQMIADKAEAQKLLPGSADGMVGQAQTTLNNANGDVATNRSILKEARRARGSFVKRVFTLGIRSDDQKLARQNLRDAKANRNAAQDNLAATNQANLAAIANFLATHP